MGGRPSPPGAAALHGNARQHGPVVPGLVVPWCSQAGSPQHGGPQSGFPGQAKSAPCSPAIRVASLARRLFVDSNK